MLHETKLSQGKLLMHQKPIWRKWIPWYTIIFHVTYNIRNICWRRHNTWKLWSKFNIELSKLVLIMFRQQVCCIVGYWTHQLRGSDQWMEFFKLYTWVHTWKMRNFGRLSWKNEFYIEKRPTDSAPSTSCNTAVRNIFNLK